jgi:hypothetical protein
MDATSKSKGLSSSSFSISTSSSLIHLIFPLFFSSFSFKFNGVLGYRRLEPPSSPVDLSLPAKMMKHVPYHASYLL